MQVLEQWWIGLWQPFSRMHLKHWYESKQIWRRGLSAYKTYWSWHAIYWYSHRSSLELIHYFLAFTSFKANMLPSEKSHVIPAEKDCSLQGPDRSSYIYANDFVLNGAEAKSNRFMLESDIIQKNQHKLFIIAHPTTMLSSITNNLGV